MQWERVWYFALIGGLASVAVNYWSLSYRLRRQLLAAQGEIAYLRDRLAAKNKQFHATRKG